MGGLPKTYRHWQKRLRLLAQRAWRWWHWHDRRHPLGWRILNGAATLLLLVTLVLPLLQQLVDTSRYQLSADGLSLVGKTDPTLSKQLSYDAQTQAFQFNKDAVTDQANPFKNFQAQIGTAQGTKKDKSRYALDVPVDFSQGVTYHDINSQLSFSLIPEFSAANGKVVGNHLVYPLSDNRQAVYTLKNNGLKEDILVNKATTDSITFTYDVRLPDTLEMKVIPNSGGNIGIYSANPALFGNVSYGSDKDRLAVEKARANSPKDYLVFGLPAPTIKAVDGSNISNATARFQLTGSKLSVIASGLLDIKAAFSIDPSVLVTSTADFQTGNNEDNNIDFSTSGQINRAPATGGSLSGGWNPNSTTGVLNINSGVFAYNGYFYIVDGSYNSNSPVAYYVAICTGLNTNGGCTLSSPAGSLGTWTPASTPLVGRNYPGVATYNGYAYIWGGYNTTTGALNSTEYAKINSDGTLGTWQSGSTMGTAECRAGNVQYGGYIYAVGGTTTPASNCGNTSTGLTNITQYAPLNADGSIGTWSTTTSLTYATLGVMSPMATAYNGYMYMLVGTKDGASNYNNIQYVKINSDGTLGSWMDTVAWPGGGGDYRAGITVANGYIYTVGNASQGTTTRYVPINANGSLGTWQTTSNLNTGRWGNGTTFYNGYIYTYGGSTPSGATNDVEYAKIDPAGMMTSFATTTALTGTDNVITDAGTIASNGYIYTVGGFNGTSYVTTTHYAPLSISGTIGTWNTTAALNTAVGDAGLAVYNGNMYVVGGVTTTGPAYTTVVQYAPINSNGTLSAWSTTTALGNAQGNHPVTAYNGYLYVASTTGGGSTTGIQYASINSNGTVGAWNSTNSLNTARVFESLVAYGGYVYALGGTNLSSVEYAPINSNGTLGTWTLTSSMTTVRAGTAAFVANGYIYYVGGDTSGTGTETATTEYAQINSNGTLGTWAANASMAGTVHRGQISYYNGFVYSVSGKIAGATTANTYYAQVNNSGSGAPTATTTSSSSTFTTARYGQGTVVYNGYMYVIAGHAVSGTYATDVQYAPLNADGTVGTWNSTNSTYTNNDRADFGAVAYNGYMYVISGTHSTSIYSDVEYAPINGNGTLGTWSSGGTITGRYGLGAAVYNGYLYALGGCTAISVGACSTITNLVEYAPLNSNGSVGTWNSTTGFTSNRFGITAQAYNGYMYVLGGCTTYASNSCTATNNDVQYAPINVNGTLGSWVTTTPFNNPRYISSSTVYNGYMYVFGGRNGSTLYNDVQLAPINTNGTLGTWSTTSTTFTTGRFSLGSGAYNGYLYIAGGCAVTSTNCGSSLQNDTQYVGLSTIARVAHYSKLLDLSGVVNATGITYNGTAPPGVVTVMYRSAGSNGVLSTAALASSLTNNNSCYGTTSSPRYIWLSITLDDSYGAGTDGAFPDGNGNANLTDITLNYTLVHPAPNIRLRTGQTLQNGNLSALDTCYP